MNSQSSTRKIAEKIAVINDRSVFLGFDVYMTLELLCKTPQQWMDADVEQQAAWRVETYKKLNMVLGKKKIVSRPTLRRWLALDGDYLLGINIILKNILFSAVHLLNKLCFLNTQTHMLTDNRKNTIHNLRIIIRVLIFT